MRGEAIVLSVCLAQALCFSGQAATLYTNDGVLSARLEAERWYINRARYAPENEADRLGLVNTNAGGHPAYDVCEDLDGTNDFGTTTNQWAAYRASKPPLAPNLRLNNAASNHCRDMAETYPAQPGPVMHWSPSANFYPYGSWPWERWPYEGYTNDAASGFVENIVSATGWDDSPIEHLYSPFTGHNALFVDANVTDRAHRQSMLNETAREIGLGYAAKPWFDGVYYFQEYDTQDFAARSGEHFFTDTIFKDADADGLYTEGEGVGGIQVRLWRGTNEAAYYDLSQPSGNFAIPISSLPDGSRISVQLVNTNGTNATISIPLGYTNVCNVIVPAFSNAWYGSYTQPTGAVNIGFRQLTVTVSVARVAMVTGSTNATVTFPSLGSAPYLVQSLDSLASTNWVTFTGTTASNQQTTVTDSGQGGRGAPGTVPRRYYRVILKRD